VSVFPIAPAESRYLVVSHSGNVLLLGGVVLLATSCEVRTRRVSQSRRRPAPRGCLYGRLVPKVQAPCRRRSPGRPRSRGGLRPKWRRMGLGCPATRRGGSVLRNGERPVGPHRPHAGGLHSHDGRLRLLLSPRDPDGFLSRYGPSWAHKRDPPVMPRLKDVALFCEQNPVDL